MLKRRLLEAGLPTKMTHYSFRTGIATHLFGQGVSLEDVQLLLGHADPRTVKIHDYREGEVMRNTLPSQHEIQLNGLKSLCVHGSPRSFDDQILAGTDDKQLETILGVQEFNVFVCGPHLNMEET